MQQVDRLVTRAKLRIQRARARNAFVDVVMRVFKRHSEDDGGFNAAALTYYTFFSIFPIVLFAAAGLGYITFINAELKQDLLEAGFDSFPLLGELLDQNNLNTLEKNRGVLALLGLMLALYSGSGAVVALEHALNKINRCEVEENFFTKRLRSLKWLAMLGGGALISLVMGGLARFIGRWVGDGGGASVIAFVLGHLGGFVVGLFIFLTAYRFLTACEQTWRQVLPGAALAALCFELLKEFGAWYLERGATGREATFGAFATAAGLLVASYLLAQVTLLAAEVNAVLQERQRIRQTSNTV